MSETALVLTNITKTYPDGSRTKTVLDSVSLKVSPGEFVAIVGPSGSGKSTLLSIAGALLSPTEGDVIVGDTALKSVKPSQWTRIRRRQIGFIFQNHQLLPFLTAKEQLEVIMDKKTSSKSKIKEMLNDLGLESLIHQYPGKMSGGEKQRVAIARAFMNQPDIILADEPTASLDAERGRQVVEMIQKEVRKHNKAAIMVTHDERVLDLVDTIYHLEGGRLVRMEKQE